MSGRVPSPSHSLSSPQGGDPDWSAISMTAMISLTVSINCRLALEVHAWTRFEIGAFFLTAFFLAMTCLMFNDVYPSPIEYVVPLPSLDWSEFYGSISILYPQIAFWCCIFLITVLSLIPRMVVKGWCAPPSAPSPPHKPSV